MSKVFIEDLTLIAIADAIREKEGTTDKVPVTQMAKRITDLPSGGGDNEPTDEDLVVTGDCSYRFANNGWNWAVDLYGNRITTKDITNGTSMFNGSSNLEKIPFVINFNNCTTLTNFFMDCTKLNVCPKLRGTLKWSTTFLLSGGLQSCENIANWDDLFTPEMIEGFSSIKVTNAYSAPQPANFRRNRSLRRIPEWWYKFRLNPESTVYPTSTYSIYYYLSNLCNVLDEIQNIPVWKCAGAQTSNMFQSSFSSCFRLKNVTFETNEDGSPIVTKWKGQTISLSEYVGYAGGKSSDIVNYGIPIEKMVRDAGYSTYTYDELKDDPDWFAIDIQWSRYNHDSAVATINSLPDTSAYLATAGGTNTIKFTGNSGRATDGGAINTLTAEEIAVAAAKGWTVTLV